MTKKKTRKILNIDNDIHNLRVYDYIFAQLGYVTQGTLEPEKSIKLFKEWHPDLVFSCAHFNHTQTDGYQLALKMKKINKNVPFVMVSGNESPEARKKAEAIGIEEYFTRPFKVASLSNRINNLMLNTIENPWVDYKENNRDELLSSQRIGEILIRMKALTRAELEEALNSQGREVNRTFLGEYLLKNDIVSEEALMKALGIQYQFPYFSDLTGLVDHVAVDVMPKETAYKYSIIPLFITRDTMYVGTFNPVNLLDFDDIRVAIGLEKNIFPVISIRSHVLDMLKSLYGPRDIAREIEELEEMADVGVGEINSIDDAELIELSNLAKISRSVSATDLANSLLLHGIKAGASDIHFEVYRDSRYRIRFRIDGVLSDLVLIPVPIANKLISRFKVMADLDISNRQTPQDGRAKAYYNGKLVNLRIAILPGFGGEKLVIRVLNKDSILVPVESLGIRGETLNTFLNAISRPQGFILVTGPTGCGKTTTLYSSLYKIGSSEKSIVTIEDPVEYRIERFNQVQVDNARGLSFAPILRSVLRQDPNIILVGEIRDEETARVAVNAALTGHLILSTLHTSSSFEAPTRLVDMGVQPFLLSASLSCVIAQRLVRRLCSNCRQPYSPGEDLLNKLSVIDSGNNMIFYKPGGCSECRNTGYRGRIGLFEILNVTPEVRRFIQEQKDPHVFKEEMRKRGMRSLWDDGLDCVIEGVTSVEEIQAVLAGEALI